MASEAFTLEDLLKGLPEELLKIVFYHLPNNALTSASHVCHLWAVTAEAVFRDRAQHWGLRLPRIPRGVFKDAPLPWRVLILEHSCKGCRGAPEFPVLKAQQTQVGFLCKKCILNNTAIRAYLERHSLSVATESINGKDLFRAKRKRTAKSP
eukprot:m.159831 g.159831  ORF g.159831 m.159831 type:complete len:152 (-) comp15184_c12_seq2:408-863(-)